ncbi:hypothetical protein RYX36_023943 [Vicia faba]
MSTFKYKSKEVLEAYIAHPSYLGVIRGSVLLIIDDLMMVDWVADDADLVPVMGSAIRVTLMKLKEGVGRKRELEEVDSDKELVQYQKDKVRDRVESVVVVDYVEPLPPPP